MLNSILKQRKIEKMTVKILFWSINLFYIYIYIFLQCGGGRNTVKLVENKYSC